MAFMGLFLSCVNTRACFWLLIEKSWKAKASYIQQLAVLSSVLLKQTIILTTSQISTQSIKTVNVRLSIRIHNWIWIYTLIYSYVINIMKELPKLGARRKKCNLFPVLAIQLCCSVSPLLWYLEALSGILFISRFSAVQKHTVEFNQLAMANSEGSEAMLNRVMTKDNIGVAVLLEVRKEMMEVSCE